MKNAFSMIELVFVIVILGILGAVAVPKFSGVQDDALISAEKSSITVARQGVITLYGKRLVRGRDFNITLNNFSGSSYTTLIIFTNSYFPKSLSVNDNSDNAITDNDLAYSDTTEQYDKKAMALIVDAEDLIEWSKIDGSENSTQRWKGPASRFVSDQNSEISNNNYWEYNNTSGKIRLR